MVLVIDFSLKIEHDYTYIKYMIYEKKNDSYCMLKILDFLKE